MDLTWGEDRGQGSCESAEGAHRETLPPWVAEEETEAGMWEGGEEQTWRLKNQSGDGCGAVGDGGRSGLVMRGCVDDGHCQTVSHPPWPRAGRVSLLPLAPPPETRSHTYA